MSGSDHVVGTDSRKSKEELVAKLETLRRRLSELERTRASEKREATDQLMNSVPALIAYIDRDKRFRFSNKAYEQMFGLSTDQICGHPVKDVLGESAYRIAEPNIERALAGQQVEFENVVRNSEGVERHTSISYIPDFDEGGAVKGLFVLVVDDTKRKQAEADWQQSEAHLRSILESAVDGIITIDEHGIIESFNRAGERIFGYEANEVVGRNVKMLMPEPDRAGHDGYIDAFLRTGEARIIGIGREVQGRRKDGTTLDLHLGIGEVQHGERRIFIGTLHDLSERKGAEDALAEKEARLRAILENAVDGIITIDRHGTVESFNRAAERIFGYEANEVVGRNVKMLMPEPDRAGHDGYIDAFLRTGKARIIGIGREVRGRRKDGTVVDLDLGIGEVRHGEHRIFIGTLHDLTERKRIEEQLRQSQKLEALGRLAGGIAHDFNNLLLPIITIAEVTRDDFPPDGREWSNLDKVVKAGQRGRALVDKILKFSRRQPMHRQPIGLAKVIAEALELARALTPSTIQVRTHIDDDVGTVLADPNQIHEVVMNLVSNAGQAIGLDKGVIDVSLRKASVNDAGGGPAALQAGTYARLTVRDTGIGMDEETLANIFDPFFTTKPAGEGTGMGLAAVHGIVAQHDGLITASSEPGEKTTFEIYLPVVD